MIGRELPFVTLLESLPDNEAALRRQEALRLMISTDGWQLVLECMRTIQDTALTGISQGADAPFLAGQIAAVESMRERIRQTVGEDLTDTYDEGLTNE